MKISLAILALAVVATADSLKSYNVDPAGVTTGGLSAGAFFAVQYHIAHSSVISGASVFAGGPYYCSQGSLSGAEITCMNAISPPSLPTLLSYAKQQASSGAVDDLSNISGDNVFLYSGTGDTVVKSSVVKSAAQLYQQLGANVTSQFAIASEHCQPTATYGNACSNLGTPYINNCDYDGAGTALEAMYGNLESGTQVAGNLLSFDQTKFGAASANSMGDTGYIYVPSACQKNATCKLHVNFHGCEQTVGDIQETYVQHAGFNGYAEANNIIVLYPQVKRSQFAPSNPNGCFDWWGYTTADFATQNGPQVKIVHAMVQTVMAGATASSADAAAAVAMA